MAKAPVVFRTSHTINFSDLDPYQHMRTAAYSAYYIDHRMTGLRDVLGWDLKALEASSFMAWMRRMELDFVSPAVGDQPIVITSFVREFRGPDAHIECTMAAAEGGKVLARCAMVVACVDKGTRRAIAWPEDAMARFYQPDPA